MSKIKVTVKDIEVVISLYNYERIKNTLTDQGLLNNNEGIYNMVESIIDLYFFEAKKLKGDTKG